MNMIQEKSGAARGAVLTAIAVAALVAAGGCTDLEESPFSAITPTNFYGNEEEVRAGQRRAGARIYLAFSF